MPALTLLSLSHLTLYSLCEVNFLEFSLGRSFLEAYARGEGFLTRLLLAYFSKNVVIFLIIGGARKVTKPGHNFNRK
jgi:hypothetical protein